MNQIIPIVWQNIQQFKIGDVSKQKIFGSFHMWTAIRNFDGICQNDGLYFEVLNYRRPAVKYIPNACIIVCVQIWMVSWILSDNACLFLPLKLCSALQLI